MAVRYLVVFCTLFTLAAVAGASPASDAELAQFKADGGADFSAQRGKADWTKQVPSSEGELRSCSACHGPDPTKTGQHATTKKLIEPMAVSANPERFTDQKKMDKWLKRNCEWAWGRECTAQEKGDILSFLLEAK